MNVEIKQLPALRVAAVRHIGPYNQVTEAFHDDPNVVPVA